MFVQLPARTHCQSTSSPIMAMIPYPKFGMGKKQIMPWWRGSEDDESSDNESREGHTGSPWGEGQIVPHQAMPLLSILSLPSSKLKTVSTIPTRVVANCFTSVYSPLFAMLTTSQAARLLNAMIIFLMLDV